MFHRGRETRNQARNREASAEPSSHNQLEDVTDTEGNQLSEELADENGEAFNHAHDTFKSGENEAEADRISSMNIAKKSRKQLKLRIAQAERDRAIVERDLLKIRIKFIEHQQTEYRRVHNNDHYRHEKRKKTSRIKESGEQKIANYRTLNIWFRDCENYFANNPENFSIETNKIRYAASRLTSQRRDQWRKHADEITEREDLLIWQYFRTHVKGWLNTLVIRSSKTKLKLEKANQRINQSVNDFAAYLNNLYAQLEDLTSEVVKMWYLRIKCNEKIRQKAQRLNTKYDNITQMRENYIDIKQFLRSSHQLLNQSSQSQSQSSDDRDENQTSSREQNNSSDATDNAKQSNTQIVQANLSVRIRKNNNNNQ